MSLNRRADDTGEQPEQNPATTPVSLSIIVYILLHVLFFNRSILQRSARRLFNKLFRSGVKTTRQSPWKEDQALQTATLNHELNTRQVSIF